jgi:hypothetical protein
MPEMSSTMEVLAWIWWVVATGLGAAWTVLWFLIGGWVATLLQIFVLIGVIYVLKYGWQRAPSEIWRRTSSFSRFFWSWLRAKEPSLPSSAQTREVVRIVRIKEVGDVNISTLLSLAAILGFGCVALFG